MTTYPIRVEPDIYQYGENVFVWFDETGGVGGASNYLEEAKAQMKRYAEGMEPKMTDYNNGEIHGWNGGDCPVHPNTKVQVWCRGTTGSFTDLAIGWRRSWLHLTGSYDIIAFQVITPYAEPKVIWMNEYKDGICHAYKEKADAIAWAKLSATRIAVKYVEVKDE